MKTDELATPAPQPLVGRRPCPFCGCPAMFKRPNGRRTWVLACDNDECPVKPKVAGAKTQKEALLRWNQRAGAST